MPKEHFSHPTESESDSRTGAENPLILRWMSAIHGIFHPVSLGIRLATCALTGTAYCHGKRKNIPRSLGEVWNTSLGQTLMAEIY